ncbi:copper resistance protein CopC [Priestia megaterium]
MIKGNLLPLKSNNESNSQNDLFGCATFQKGIYTVSYSVISADSHPVQGTYVFSIGKK